MVSIIHEINTNEKNCTIQYLAKQFHISERTIRNDLNTINDLLSASELPQLELKSGGKIVKSAEFSNILDYVSESDFYNYKLSKEERIHVASALLVSSSDYITLSTIADNLFVSRATVINDLDDMKEYIKKGNLEVFSYPNKGLKVAGKESDKRYFLMGLVHFKANTTEQDMLTKHISVQAGNRIVIQKIVKEQEHFHKNHLTDSSYQKLILYLGIMVNRNMQGEYIEVRKKEHIHKYRMAQDILKYISQYCHIDTTENEVYFLSEILSDCHYIKQNDFKKDVVKIQLIARQFIEAVSEELGNNLNGDYDFFENLSNHFVSVFADKPFEYQSNSIVDDALEDNQDVLPAVENCLTIITTQIKRELTDDEIKYIAFHVCAAIERKKNKEIAFHVIVACHAGIGTSQLLLEKLKQHFNFQIVDVVSSHEAKGIEVGKADFIISTIPLKGCKLDYVTVSPMLTDEDYLRVGNKIDTLRNSRNLPSHIDEKELSAKGLIERIYPILYEDIPDYAEELMKKIRKVIRDYFNQSIEYNAEIFSPYLHHLLPASHIEIDVECSDWKDAIQKSAQKLLKLGYIEERYIDAMIANIEENGPYIVISKGFAVPHEGLEQGSIKVGMNLIRLKNPVEFGAEEFDPVEFVCCLSAVDHKTHLKAFFNLVNMLQNDNIKQQLHSCKTAKEIAAIIEKYEYSL